MEAVESECDGSVVCGRMIYDTAIEKIRQKGNGIESLAWSGEKDPETEERYGYEDGNIACRTCVLQLSEQVSESGGCEGCELFF